MWWFRRRVKPKHVQGMALRLPMVLVAVLALTACGWRLQGAFHLPPEFSPVYVQDSGRGSRLGYELRDQLRLAGVAQYETGEAFGAGEAKPARQLRVVFDDAADPPRRGGAGSDHQT